MNQKEISYAWNPSTAVHNICMEERTRCVLQEANKIFNTIKLRFFSLLALFIFRILRAHRAKQTPLLKGKKCFVFFVSNVSPAFRERLFSSVNV